MAMYRVMFPLGDEGEARFEVIYRGFMWGGAQKRRSSEEMLVREGQILAKLQGISEPFPCGRMLPGGEEPCRRLKAKRRRPTVLALTGPQMALLRSYVALCPWVPGASTKRAIDALTHLRVPRSVIRRYGYEQ